jgi:hypothetical protein
VFWWFLQHTWNNKYNYDSSHWRALDAHLLWV